MTLLQQIHAFLEGVGGVEYRRKESGFSEGEVAMWRAVILQALVDACSHSPRTRACLRRIEAQLWLEGTSKDFLRVCDFAGFEPCYVRRMAKKIIASHLRFDLSGEPPKKLKRPSPARREKEPVRKSRKPGAAETKPCEVLIFTVAI